MVKKIIIKKKTSPEMTINEKDKQFVQDLIANESISRATLLNKMFDSRRDIDLECGYPKSLTPEQYKLMYDREGISTRVVALYPEECWTEDPTVEEDDSPDDTEFEKAFKELDKERQLFSYMMRVDELSGIGRFGILLLGLDDGKDLNLPVDGLNERGEKTGNAQYELLYLRSLDESCVTIKDYEKDMSNPRYGKPVMYSVAFENVNSTEKEKQVHWTRVIHIADNRKSSEVYGTPRMQIVFNRLYDLRKIAGGSAEMFWKGGFPGYSFEMDPNAKAMSTTEITDMKNSIAAWQDGLQRVIRTQGVKVNSLGVQVADPKDHVVVQLEMIAISIGVPLRIFMGSEQAKLASSKDVENWNKRLRRRRIKYLTPYVVRPTIDRLIALGVLPEPSEYDIKWGDLDAPSDAERAEVMKVEVEAFSKYVQGQVETLIPPEIFLKMYAKLEPEEIKEIMEQALEIQKKYEEEEAELIKAADKEQKQLDKQIKLEEKNKKVKK